MPGPRGSVELGASPDAGADDGGGVGAKLVASVLAGDDIGDGFEATDGGEAVRAGQDGSGLLERGQGVAADGEAAHFPIRAQTASRRASAARC